MSEKNDALKYLSVKLRAIMNGFGQGGLYEIRLRADRPLVVSTDEGEFFVGENGRKCSADNAYIVTVRDIRETLEYVSNYSLYAFEDEISKGYITMNGGNRVGVCGHVVADGRKVLSIRNISFINIRIAHQVIGCADGVMNYIYTGNGNRIFNTLIASPPGMGKTTLLRDMIRNLSDGSCGHEGQTVGVADERSEIASCKLGVPQNDVGIRTDVLDACPKSKAIVMLTRAMNPRVIAVDEIGDEDDVAAICNGINCGVSMIATVHAESYDELADKPAVNKLIGMNVFKRIIMLGDNKVAGRIGKIYDERGNTL